ncbi:MAG: hypothetical protein FJ010_13520 [Chloroflexi bacterium]|nr:hypothetical protein [Chloroflexota bacterium]
MKDWDLEERIKGWAAERGQGEVDPKLAWARQALQGAPVEINTAPREMLLRVPGVGPKGVEAILRARRQHKLRDLSQLSKLGVLTRKAAPFVLLDGAQPARQLVLF